MGRCAEALRQGIEDPDAFWDETPARHGRADDTPIDQALSPCHRRPVVHRAFPRLP
jgi:hypothetical protein